MKRSDIQALRGFAVLAVLLYHLQISPFKGGFLGVDIFFVISGFVITQRLARGEGSIKAQILDFYQRRAKRILPASLLVIAFTALAMRLLLAPLAFKRFGLDGIATTLFAGNIRFAVQGNDYLNQSMSPTPFLHYWSLGVEEQFYLIWPLLFLFFFKSRKKLILLFTLFATVFAIWYTHTSPVNSFYLPYSRAWEFLAGILVAIVIPGSTWSHMARNLMAILGWIGVSASVFLIGSDLPVPGFSTFVPVMSAMVIVWSNASVPWERLLERMGDYSYSIYLVHWPLIVIALSRYQKLSVTTDFIIATLTIFLGYLISNFVERPLRFNKKFAIGLPAWGTAVLAVAALLFGATSFAAPQISTAKSLIDLREPVIYADKCHLDFGISQPKSECLFGDLKSSMLIVLAGDSHAAQWFSGLNAVAIKNHWKLLSLTKSSCPAALMPTKRNGVADTSCAQWQRYLVQRINQLHPAKVFLTAFSEYNYPLVQNGDYASLYTKDQSAFIAALKVAPSSIYYIEDTPRPTQSIPDCISKNLKEMASCNFLLSRSAATLAIREGLSKVGIHYLNFNTTLCPANKCSAIYSGKSTYRDASHISVNTSLALTSELEMAALK